MNRGELFAIFVKEHQCLLQEQADPGMIVGLQPGVSPRHACSRLHSSRPPTDLARETHAAPAARCRCRVRPTSTPVVPRVDGGGLSHRVAEVQGGCPRAATLHRTVARFGGRRERTGGVQRSITPEPPPDPCDCGERSTARASLQNLQRGPGAFNGRIIPSIGREDETTGSALIEPPSGSHWQGCGGDSDRRRHPVSGLARNRECAPWSTD